MQANQSIKKEMIQEWVTQNEIMGKTSDDMNGTTFVHGNELLMLKSNGRGGLEVEPLEVPEVIVFNKEYDASKMNICNACGMEHPTIKEVTECCAELD